MSGARKSTATIKELCALILQKMREEAHAQAVAADLAELRRLRHYLIFDKKAGVRAEDLIDAIDDYAGRLTGDRRTLHGRRHSIGGS